MNRNSFNFNFFEKILFVIFRKYTYKVYNKGTKDGYNWKK